MARKTKLLVAAGLAATSLMGVLTSESGPWPVDRGVDLTYAISAAHDSIALKKDSGDVTCFLLVKLPAAAVLTRATLDRQQLHFSKDGEWWRIEDLSAPPPAAGRFNWHGGGLIRIRGTALDLLDWELHRASGVADSMTRTSRRGYWWMLSVTLLVLSVAGVIVQALQPADAPQPFRVTAANCTFEAVDCLKADKKKDTLRMREILKDSLVLRGASPDLSRSDRELLLQGRERLRQFLFDLSRDLSKLARDLGL